MTKDRLLAILNRIKPYLIRKNRLRSGWRIALYLIASLVTLIVFGLAFESLITFAWFSRGISLEGIKLIIADFATKPFNYPDVALGFFVVRAVIALTLIWIFRKWIDKRPFRNLGFQLTSGWWRELGAGFAFVTVAWGAIFLFSLAFRGVTIIGFVWDEIDSDSMIGALALGLIFNFLVGVVEEADARGYILQNLAQGIRLVPAILISSLYFGLLHLFNPGAGWQSTLGIFIGGILLAMGLYVTRRLWFSIGMHAAWNFAEGPVFGFRVSGLDMGGLFRLKITGPEWLMGGAFGPEAGLLAIFVEITMIGMLLYLAQPKEARKITGRILVRLRSILK